MSKFQYSAGIPGYGTRGVDGSIGQSGLSSYFSSYDGTTDTATIKIKILANKILYPTNQLLPDGRIYQNGDTFVDKNGRIFIIDLTQTNKYTDTGIYLNTSQFFSPLKNSPTYSFERFSNLYITNPNLLDIVYSSNVGDYTTYPTSIYNVTPADYAQVKFVDKFNKFISNVYPFEVWSIGSATNDDAIALVREQNSNIWHLGNIDASVQKNVSLHLDFTDVSVAGNLQVINLKADNLNIGKVSINDISGNIIPTVDSIYDIGSITNKWNNIWGNIGRFGIIVDQGVGQLLCDTNFYPNVDDTYDLGSPSFRWANLNLSNELKTAIVSSSTVYSNIIDSSFYKNIIPYSNNTYNLGSTAKYWNDAYLTNLWSSIINTTNIITNDITSFLSHTSSLDVSTGLNLSYATPNQLLATDSFNNVTSQAAGSVITGNYATDIETITGASTTDLVTPSNLTAKTAISTSRFDPSVFITPPYLTKYGTFEDTISYSPTALISLGFSAITDFSTFATIGSLLVLNHHADITSDGSISMNIEYDIRTYNGLQFNNIEAKMIGEATDGVASTTFTFTATFRRGVGPYYRLIVNLSRTDNASFINGHNYIFNFYQPLFVQVL